MADRRRRNPLRHLEDPTGTPPSDNGSGSDDGRPDHDSRRIDGDDADRIPHAPCVDRTDREQHCVDVLAPHPDEACTESDGEADVVDGPSPAAKVDPAVRNAHWYALGTMAKAKRRKLRARRSKANHGRKPNAGRG